MAKIREDLVGSVLVENPEGGDPIVLTAGDKVPKGIQLGEHVLAAKSSASDEGGQTPAPPAGGAQAGENVEPLVIPPKAGAGSGVDAWRAYAVEAIKRAGLNIAFDDAASRSDIIAALDAEKIATE